MSQNNRVHSTAAKPLTAPSTADTFRVECACGAVASGQRADKHQVVVCDRCHSRLFVLPKSPWRPAPGESGPVRSQRRRDWLMPVLGAAAAIACALAIYVWFLAHLGNATADFPISEARNELLARKAEAEKLIVEGNPHLALAALKPGNAVLNLDGLSTSERLQWRQVQEQAALLVDLSTEPIEEILRHAAGVRESEWSAEFERRYRDKVLIFDAEFRRSANGAWEMAYPLVRDKARLVVENVTILKKIPGAGPERVILGIRLASVCLEAPGPTWVVRFQPDSGVFITSPCWPFTGDAIALDDQRRMADWLER